MLDFDLETIYPMLSSDEGPPFGRDVGITTDGWCDRAITLIYTMVRWN